MLQSLVEKHFPAPDRSRIHRLLGLDIAKKDDKKGKQAKNGFDDIASGSSGKRKPGNKVAIFYFIMFL